MLYVGIDVGRFFDKTAIVSIDPDYTINHVVTLKGVDFLRQARFIAEKFPSNAIFYMDCTGMGVGLYDYLAPKRVVKPVTICAGASIKWHRAGYRVGKAALMQLIALSLDKIALNTNVDSAMKTQFHRELRHMQVKPGKIAKFGASSGQHDDLVVAFGCALLGLHYDGPAH